MPVDSRILGVKELDRHRTVLTDAHSLSRLYRLEPPLQDDRFEPAHLIHDPSLANLVQNLGCEVDCDVVDYRL